MRDSTRFIFFCETVMPKWTKWLLSRKTPLDLNKIFQISIILNYQISLTVILVGPIGNKSELSVMNICMHHSSRSWFVACLAWSHVLNQWWCIYAPGSFNVLNLFPASKVHGAHLRPTGPMWATWTFLSGLERYQYWPSFYYHRIILIPAWISYVHYIKCRMKLIIHAQTVKAVKFGNG